MFVFFLSRASGRVDVVDGAWIATDFLQCFGVVPLIPQRSYVRFDDGREAHVGLGARFHWRSVVAGYLRSWCAIAVVAGTVVAVRRPDAWPASALVVVVSAALLAYAWTSLARVSPESAAQRRVYAEIVGAPFDVGDVWPMHDQLRARLRPIVARELESAATSYRASPSDVDALLALAAAPDVTGDALLRAALALARIEEAEATGDRRRRFTEMHAAIWAKLVRLRASSSRDRRQS